MGKTFLGISWLGALGLSGSVLAIAFFGDTTETKFALAFSTIFALLGLIGFVGTKAKSYAAKPEVGLTVSEVLAKTTETSVRAADSSTLVFKSSLLPRLQYLLGFSGQADRKEFLLSQLVGGILFLIFFVVLFSEPVTNPSGLALLLLLLVTISMLSFGVRRTRDAGLSHWWFLLVLVPPIDIALWILLLLAPTGEFKGSRLAALGTSNDQNTRET